ncbi:MAG: mucoidy inhibitor MuiA family protein, partial [Opitutaceae bacterium]|nr:mucoidy inhibitor MuiA family protein [Opitutaceae bacterium]
KIAGDRAGLDDERTDLQAKIDAVQSQLNELRGTGGRSFKTVTVRVAAQQPGNLDVALSYTVPGASWAPSYDARVLSGERAVALGYFGIVRQSTGEDWKDVALTLSTARPGLGGAAPVLVPWNLDVFNPRLMRDEEVALDAFEVRAGRASAKLAAPAAVNMQTLTSNAPPPPEYDANSASATVEAGATSASFKIAVASSVPSDNSPQKVPITAAKLNAQPEYLTVPKRQATAYLTAKVYNNTEFPLLAGAMNVFLDGTFVATSSLRTVMAGEKFDLALGADEGISVKHKRVNKFTEDTGLTNSGKRITYEYLITVQNNKKTAERVIVADQVPLSRNEKIVVKVIAPDGKEVKPTDEGTLKWTLELKPAEKRELTIKFTVDYPNDVNVSGLE